MKKLMIATALTASLGSAFAHAEKIEIGDQEIPHSVFGGKVLWSESQGVVTDNAIIDMPERSCKGDIAVDLVNLSMPKAVTQMWEVNASASIASNRDAFIINVGADFVGDGFTPLSTDFKPTAEVILQCREPGKVSISADENGELIFHTKDAQMAEVLSNLDLNYTYDAES